MAHNSRHNMLYNIFILTSDYLCIDFNLISSLGNNFENTWPHIFPSFHGVPNHIDNIVSWISLIKQLYIIRKKFWSNELSSFLNRNKNTTELDVSPGCCLQQFSSTQFFNWFNLQHSHFDTASTPTVKRYRHRESKTKVSPFVYKRTTRECPS